MMMKKLSLLLAILMLFTYTVPVWATEPEEEIQSNDSSGGVDESIWEEMMSRASGDEAEEDLSGKTVNLALIIDTTGSMSSYITGVVRNLAEFVRYIENTGAKLRLALIDYRDITCDEETIVHTFDHSVWSQSTEQLIDEMKSLYVSGGGDDPETLLDALGFLVDESVMTFNSDAAKFAIVLTDAPYKVDNTHGIGSMDEMITALQEKGIQVSVMTRSYCFSDYEELVTSTGGILSPVNDFAETLKEYALTIIGATADSEVDGSIRPVTGIAAEGPSEIRPDYVYPYSVVFEPEEATDKGVFWYTENADIAEILSTSGTVCYIRGVSEGSTRLAAVSSDGGYTGTVDITVSEGAAVSGNMITYEYDAVKEALGIDDVRTIEYRVVEEAELGAEQQNEIFSALKGKERTISFVYTDSDKSIMYKWNFLGTNITNESQSMNFGIVPDAQNEDVLGAVKEDVEKMDIHFNHTGSLPGEATVSVPVKDIFSTDTLYLYYYNEETKGLELAAEGVSVVDGYATFPLMHCSDYILTAEMLRNLLPDLKPEEPVVTESPKPTEEPVITESPQPTEDTDDTDVEDTDEIDESFNNAELMSKSPKTGEDSMAPVVAGIVIVAAGLAVCGRKWLTVRNK